MAYHNGQLLIATPRLLDPNFHRAVILVLDHDVDGALGVVINRPSELPIRAVLPPWAEAVTEPQLLFAGGPVSPDSALGVGLAVGSGPAGGFKRLVDGFGLVDLDAEPDEVLPDLVGVRVFSGYTGWGGGQLEEEIQEGSWYVVNAVPTDLLHPDPGGLWRAVLRRQPGELAYVANFPDDPTLN
jgi:putative transcriptional regulator